MLRICVIVGWTAGSLCVCVVNLVQKFGIEVFCFAPGTLSPIRSITEVSTLLRDPPPTYLPKTDALGDPSIGAVHTSDIKADRQPPIE